MSITKLFDAAIAELKNTPSRALETTERYVPRLKSGKAFMQAMEFLKLISGYTALRKKKESLTNFKNKLVEIFSFLKPGFKPEDLVDILQKVEQKLLNQWPEEFVTGFKEKSSRSC